MRKILFIPGYFILLIMASGCRGKDNPGRVYMPDMAYSRAYETYGGYDTSKFTNDRNAWGRNEQSKIFYNNMPVAGTVARGDMPRYPFANDTAGYAQSASYRNPLDTSTLDIKEAGRLYMVYCGICHGAKLDGNGPLYNGGNGPFPAAPKNLMGDDMKALPEGTMFHVMTYGKGMMGSYASQLSSEQRWAVAAYVKSQQAGGKAATDTSSVSRSDTTATGGGTK